MEGDSTSDERAFAAFVAQVTSGAYTSPTSVNEHQQQQQQQQQESSTAVPQTTVSPCALQRPASSQDQNSGRLEVERSPRSHSSQHQEQEARPHGDNIDAVHAQAEQRQRTSGSPSPSSPSIFVSTPAQRLATSNSFPSESSSIPTPPPSSHGRPPSPPPQQQDQETNVIPRPGNDSDATSPSEGYYTYNRYGNNSVHPLLGGPTSDSASSGVVMVDSDANPNLNSRAQAQGASASVEIGKGESAASSQQTTTTTTTTTTNTNATSTTNGMTTNTSARDSGQRSDAEWMSKFVVLSKSGAEGAKEEVRCCFYLFLSLFPLPSVLLPA